MPMESTCMLFIIMMLQCPCMQARRDSPPRSPNATGSVAVQDSHRPVRPSTGSTAGGPTDADVDAHQETCSRECDTNRSSSNPLTNERPAGAFTPVRDAWSTLRISSSAQFDQRCCRCVLLSCCLLHRLVLSPLLLASPTLRVHSALPLTAH